MGLLDALLPQLEVAVEKLIADKSDELVDLALKEITKLIPGQIDDAVAAAAAPLIKEEFKKLLLAQAEKISAE